MIKVTASPEQPEAPLFCDGLGERVVAADAATGELLQILRIRQALTAVPSFEFALRERTARLANFRHAYFARVRRVDRVQLPAPGLAIMSDHVEGTRLSDILRVAHERGLQLDINAALCLIRQLVPAVALLHENARDVAHGLIAPERLIVTPHARLVVAEHVLAAAIEQLHYSRERLWQDFRIAVPPSAGLARFDHRADVAGIGLVSLALVLGRPIELDEFPNRIPVLLNEARERTTLGSDEPLSAPLREWLARALQLDSRRAFASAPEALSALEELVADDSVYIAAPIALEAFLSAFTAELLGPPPVAPPQAASTPVRLASAKAEPELVAPVPETPAETLLAPLAPVGALPAPPVEPFEARAIPSEDAVSDGDDSLFPDLDSAFAILEHEVETAAAGPLPHAARHQLEPAPDQRVQPPAAPPQQPAVRPIVPAGPVPQPPAGSGLPAAPAPATVERAAAAPQSVVVNAASAAPKPGIPARSPLSTSLPLPESAPAGTRRAPSRWVAVAAVAIVALAGSGLLASRYFRAGAAATTTGTIVVQSNPAGVQVFIDGVDHGLTPARVELPPGAHILELRGQGVPRVIPFSVAADAEVSHYVELASIPDTGGLRIESQPVGAKVIVDGIERGTAPLTVEGLVPGDHEVVLQTAAGSVQHVVAVQAGATASLVAPVAATPQTGPISGWLSVKAPFSMEIREDGRVIGTTDVDRMMMAAGRHEIQLVNQALGYRVSRVVQVQPGRVATLTIELPNGVVNLNAAPWAEVWIDGQRVGETPIGNLSVPIGAHEVVFRHPQLGEKRHAISVTVGVPVRLSVDMK